ncbi:MAG: sporulation protein YqfD [Bacilli bacterium]|nr:sporulation protein YqfD [Bacilli bacterium]MDD4406748.1 sporulation protein YqfD [Bacilli bacterium]
MNSFIIIEVKGYIDRFIKKLIKNHISIYNINYLSNDKILIKINLHDYKVVKRLGYLSKIKIIKYKGSEGIKKHIRNNIYIYIIILLCFALMDILTSYIVKIDIIHENSQVRKLVKEELKTYGIKRFSLKREFDDLEKIKNKILDNNRNKLEWISITRKGMIYEIRIEERIITDTSKEEGHRHLISYKNALITKVICTKGDLLVRSGDYVKKGDILISGEIKLFDEVKGNILATGEVYGDVWYTSDIRFPLYYEEKTFTGKKRFNLSINNKILFKNKYQYFDQTGVRKIKILGFNFSFYNEEEYLIKTKKYNEKEAEKNAINKVLLEFNKKLNGKGKVISQKVLKKEQNNSTINISIFVITNELISKPLYYQIGSEINDTKNSS